MMAYIDGELKRIPDKLSGRAVKLIIPLDYLLTEHARNHHRLQVFAEKGVQCVVPGCPCKGAFMALTDYNHVDLYTSDFRLMTVDHHIARSNGGGDTLENKFPMCEKHNSKKGASDPEIFYEKFGS